MMSLEQFHKYMMDFYGVDSGLYPELAFTLSEIQHATQKHIDSGFDFAADSVDREMIRDLILNARGV